MNTIIQFQLVRFDENEYAVIPDTLYVFGWINFNMLVELITSPDYVNNIRDDIEIGSNKITTLEVWEDWDDYRSWLDYKLLSDDFDVPTPSKQNIDKLINE